MLPRRSVWRRIPWTFLGINYSTYRTTLEACIDARGVHSAIEAKETKTPAESSLLTSVQSVRELLDLKRLQALHWIDTRDMLGDGLSKGSVQRDAIIKLLSQCQWHQVGDTPVSLWAYLAQTPALVGESEDGLQFEAFPDGRTVYYKWTTVQCSAGSSAHGMAAPANPQSCWVAGGFTSSGLSFLRFRAGIG